MTEGAKVKHKQRSSAATHSSDSHLWFTKSSETRTSGDGSVTGFATTMGNVTVSDHAKIAGWATVEGNVHVSGWATVEGNVHVVNPSTRPAFIRDNAVVKGRAAVFGAVTVEGESVVTGTASLKSEGKRLIVAGSAKISGNAVVAGAVTVEGNARVTGAAFVSPTDQRIVLGEGVWLGYKAYIQKPNDFMVVPLTSGGFATVFKIDPEATKFTGLQELPDVPQQWDYYFEDAKAAIIHTTVLSEDEKGELRTLAYLLGES